MSVRLYDDALVEKFGKWTAGRDVKVLSPQDTSLLQQVHLDKIYVIQMKNLLLLGTISIRFGIYQDILACN